MTILTTIFGIALVGVLYMLLMKLLEFRTGKNFFLPMSWLENDERIRTRSKLLLQETGMWLEKRTVTLWKTLLHFVKQKTQNAYTWLVARPQRSLHKTQTASSFLKDVNNHKQEIRRQNGYHEE